MREILFRGKSIVADSPNTPGYWLKGNYISRVLDFEDGTTVIENHIVERDSYINIYLDLCTEVWPETIGQYIGLKDRDGIRIFEGDIVEFEGCGYIPITETGVVMFNDGCFCIEYFPSFSRRKVFHRLGETSEWHDMGTSGIITYTYKVIGNVYDNPELL